MPYKTLQDPEFLRPLTKKQIEYAHARAAGHGSALKHFDKLPQVQQAIIDLRAKASAVAVYDCTAAMAKCDEAYDFAMTCNQPIAMVQSLKLKAQLAGLLIERIRVERVDLTAALDDARNRAKARIINVPSEHELLSIVPSKAPNNDQSMPEMIQHVDK